MRTRIVFSPAAPAALLCLWGTFLAPAARAQTYTGYLDGANCASIGGWAWDGTEAPLDVYLFNGSELIQKVTASQYRSDLWGVAGSGNHGYGIVTPDTLKDNQPHTIHARYSPNGPELSYSPRIFSCAYDGYMNGVTPLTINGWGWKVNSNDRMPINLYDGNQLVLQTTANQYRADLAGIGDGSHAYRAAPTGTMNNGQDHYIYARIADQGTLIDLQYSPMLLHPNPAAVYDGHFDVASCDMLAGWAVDDNHPLNRFTVAFYDGASLLPFTATANLFRQDLLDAQLGDGTYAFSMATPPWLKDGATHQITAQMQASGFVLTGSPKALSCQPPPVVSALPGSGSGSAQTFTVNVFNSAGAANIGYAYLLVNSTLSAASGCFVEYNHVANTFRLQNDAGSGWLGPITLGSAASLANSQCTITGNGASSIGAGNYLSVTIPTSFAFAFGGAKTSYGYDYDNAMNGSGWITTGSWTVPGSGSPAVVSALPVSGSGLIQTFTLTVADGAGTANISLAYFLVNSALSAASRCEVEFNRAASTLRLQNDAGSAWLGPITLGSGSLANSQCSINGNVASSVATGNNLTITIPATFAFAFVGAKTAFGYAYDNAYNGSGWVTTGTWTALPPPAVVSALPASGTGSAQTFSLTVADSAGALNIGYGYLLINSSLSAAGGCYVEYNRAATTLRLQNDAGSGWLGPITQGSAGSLANSQCSISGNGASGVANGNNLTVTIPVSFTGAFAGNKTAFGYAYDNVFNGSDWVTTGTWTVTLPPPDFTIGVAPNAAATLAGGNVSYTVTAGSLNGFNGRVDFGAQSLPAGASASFSPSYVIGPGTSNLTITAGASMVAGNYSFGVTGTSSGYPAHSGAASLVITPPPPDFTISVAPVSGTTLAGAGDPYRATYTVTAGALHGFSGSVALAASGLPTGTIATFSPSTINSSGSSTMVVTTASTDHGGVTGNYSFTVTGTRSGFAPHSAAGTLNIQDFTIALASNSTIVTSSTGTPSFQITAGGVNGFNDDIDVHYLSWQGNQPYYTGPQQDYRYIRPGQISTLTFTMNDQRNGCYFFTITAMTRGVSHPVYGTLCVQATGNFNMGVSPSTLTLTPPANTSPGGYTISITPMNNLSGAVSFLASGLPSYATATFSPPSLNVSGSGTMNTVMSVNAPAGTQAGTFNLTVTATGPGSVSQSVHPFLTIGGPPDFSLTANPSTQTLAPGGVGAYLIGVSGASGFSSSVILSASNVPQGVTASFSAGTVAPGGSSTLTLTTTANSAVGNFPVTITGTSGSLSRTTVGFLNIASATPASMLTPAPGTALRGTTATFVWTSGVSASQYQLLVGATPGGSEYYSANTGTSQSATASIPTASQPQTVYVKLGSLITGTWQYRSYSYSMGVAPTGVPGFTKKMVGQPYEVPNNGVPTVTGPWYLLDGFGHELDPRTLSSDDCQLTPTGVRVRMAQVPSQYDPLDSSSYDLEITVDRSVAPGLFTFSCKYEISEGVDDWTQQSDPVNVVDGSPEIFLPVNQIEVFEGTFYVDIHGRNFGNKQGTINICNPGLDTDPCNNIPGVVVTWAGWDDTQVNMLIQFPDGASGPYDLVLTSVGVGSNGFQPAQQGRGAKSNRAPVRGRVPAGISMKLEQIGATVISTDGRYSEDTTIQVTAVDAAGVTMPNFVGNVTITEVPAPNGRTIYSQNPGNQPNLPPSVNIIAGSGGTATFVAKSLAGPTPAGTAPNAAEIRTVNYPVWGGVTLAIPQWIISGVGKDIDALHSGGFVYDWFQARAKDIFSGANGDLATVLLAVSSYNLTSRNDAGYTQLQRAPQSPIFINPYSMAMRTDSVTGGLCGQLGLKYLKATLVHEARHAYQAAQAGIAGNDQDLDYLVNNPVAIAPADIFLDTAIQRLVCNEFVFGGATFFMGYRGGAVYDPWLPDLPNGNDRGAYADYALEMDAEVFAASHNN